MRALVLSAAAAALIAGSPVAPAWAKTPGTSGRRAPTEVGTYITDGDHVHVSARSPRRLPHTDGGRRSAVRARRRG
jgi:hypothetical protein